MVFGLGRRAQAEVLSVRAARGHHVAPVVSLAVLVVGAGPLQNRGSKVVVHGVSLRGRSNRWGRRRGEARRGGEVRILLSVGIKPAAPCVHASSRVVRRCRK
jgi:hypothetical protein